MRAVWMTGLLTLGLAGCPADDPGDGGGDCNVTAPTACPSDMPTYADVEPIFRERCVSCHQGEGQSEQCPTCWALTDYGHVASWAAEIRTAMLACEMPPPESGLTMSNAERMAILEWLRCGAPE